ncbi:MAG: hypothetical protein M3347_06180 [Armatimonadota bacterium]|nr:hypothetical protein [Armatimonadota bacterium]
MPQQRLWCALFAVLPLISTSAISISARADSGALNQPRPAAAHRIVQAYGKLPLRFEANHGQTASHTKFLARGSGYQLFLTPAEAVLSLAQWPQAQIKEQRRNKHRSARSATYSSPPAVIRLRLLGANPKPQVTGLDRIPSHSNYLIGNDPRQWRTNVPHYARVRYHHVYPGIDSRHRLGLSWRPATSGI